MNVFSMESGLLIAALTLFFFGGYAVAEDSVPKPHVVSVIDKHPLAIAQQQLKQAHEYYKKGEIDQVEKSLQAASQSLQGHQKNKAAAALASEIKQLQEKISQSSDSHESTISRLWHRSSALVAREIEHATKSWNDSSTANEILKYLIDARMHFSYAEHDLFENHDAEKANEDIKNTLAYLDKANAIANPQMREMITVLKKEIQHLPTDQTNAEEVQTILQALETAATSVEKANDSVSQEIQTRSKKIVVDIKNLKKDIFILEKHQQYDAVMEKLQKLDKFL